MNAKDTVRAWKDPEYREGLSPEEMEQVTPSPAGVTLLSRSEMEAHVGGAPPRYTVPGDEEWTCEHTVYGCHGHTANTEIGWGGYVDTAC